MRIDRDSIVSSGYIFRPFSLFRLPQNHTTKRKIKIKTKAKITEKNHTFISIFTTVTYGSEKHGVRTVTVLLRFISFCACFSFFIQCSVFSPKIRPIEQYIRTQRIVEKKKRTTTHIRPNWNKTAVALDTQVRYENARIQLE